jgi:hypothetical protein
MLSKQLSANLKKIIASLVDLEKSPCQTKASDNYVLDPAGPVF